MCAMTVAEGDAEYKTDVSVVINNGKKYVLRTSLDRFETWHLKYSHVIACDITFEGAHPKPNQVKLIDGEIWVFDTDATNAENIIQAVNIALTKLGGGGLRPSEILGNVYIKNLNIEGEQDLIDAGGDVVAANRALYTAVCLAFRVAAEHFNLHQLNFMVFSHDLNHKLPHAALRAALLAAGATDIVSDPKKYRVISGSNDGEGVLPHNTNLTIAVIPV